ncbi:MAG: hypothetical protein Q4F80_02550 [bacterium]|nr:hypothetical protein [bacterium]
MSLGIQIAVGIICGLILGFFAVMGTINSKEKELKKAWNNLVEALNVRYLKLKNVLNFLKRHMDGFQDEIDQLILLCDEAIDTEINLNNIVNRLEIENAINFKLEDIKANMANFPSLQNDPEVDEAILAIAESEAYVGEAVRAYNSGNLEYRVLIETFPVSFVAWILNKNSDIIPFSVTQKEEFDDNYIDEDEV